MHFICSITILGISSYLNVVVIPWQVLGPNLVVLGPNPVDLGPNPVDQGPNPVILGPNPVVLGPTQST